MPSCAPSFLLKTHKRRSIIKLYVRRVFIVDDCDELIPEWLYFEIESREFEGLPLNISHETLRKEEILRVTTKYMKEFERKRDL